MHSYRLSTNLKLALVLFAVLIAVASLMYTSRIVRELRAREYTVIQLWADAMSEITKTQTSAINPYQPELQALMQRLEAVARGEDFGLLSADEMNRYREALLWAQSMPPAGETSFIADALLFRDDFTIPSILTDASGPISWRHLPIETEMRTAEDSLETMRRLQELAAEMDAINEPIEITVSSPDLGELRQWIHFGESNLIRELRIFPYVQLFIVGLFILVGYLGFSYVRRSEQGSLWVGMAKEAAHQLGTPISSLMGWVELLKEGGLSEEQRRNALVEIEKDVARLQRVANRFSNIGSRPILQVKPLAPVVHGMVDYMRRRIPQLGKQVALTADVGVDVSAPLNVELFEWVLENLLKNALDAIDGAEGRILIRGQVVGDRVILDVEDNGKGIDRRQWKNIFRPGYSTKKRGWGLGLSLAKRIIEDYHGGALDVAQSRINGGTTFRIVLPAHEKRA